MSPLNPFASSGSSPSRADQLASGLGYVAMSGDPGSYTNSVAPGTQLLACTALGLNVGDTVTNLILVATVAASGTTPTLVKVGLFNSSFALVASSADSHASAIWTATGIVIAPLSAPYAVPASGVYYAGFLKNGVWGTTNPSFLSGTTQTLAGRTSGTILRRWFEQTTLTDLPNPAVPSNPVNAPLWIGAS